MNVAIIGASGFIGTNLAIHLSESGTDELTLIGQNESHFELIKKRNMPRTRILIEQFNGSTDFDSFLKGQEILYHLVSTTAPTTSNQQIANELESNVIFTARLLDACVRNCVKKVIFISSGGTVYGKETVCPIKETAPTDPISSYGIQKITIEKLLYLYQYLYGLDYRIIRLANPYGPYQRPNGLLGAVTTFTYKALKDEEIQIYGDGSVVRDYIYIDDAVRGIVRIADGDHRYRVFNLGCGYGTSINSLVKTIESTLNKPLKVRYFPSRKVDVPVNYLDISRYEECYGKLDSIPLKQGIIKTADFLRKQYL